MPDPLPLSDPLQAAHHLRLGLDLAGTFVFGLSGATLAVRRRLDIFGVLVLAVAAALAGGMLRDLLLGATPPAALRDERLLLAALAAGLTVFFCHRLIERLKKPVMVLDALGLGLFAVSGCAAALDRGLGPLPAVILGTITAVGGGTLRDLLVAEVPRVLREEVYALAAIVGGTVFVAGRALGFEGLGLALTAIALTFLLRLASVWRGWQAPRAPGS